MRNKNKTKISYEPEADVLMWEITDKPIDFAKEIGNIVVHFTSTTQASVTINLTSSFPWYGDLMIVAL